LVLFQFPLYIPSQVSSQCSRVEVEHVCYEISFFNEIFNSVPLFRILTENSHHNL
jgi:hypothetical protein